MPSSRQSREALIGILNSAFSEGLLSEHTHSYRMGMLFGGKPIDEHQMVGDLTFRESARQSLYRVRAPWLTMWENLRAFVSGVEPLLPSLLLVLDSLEGDLLLLGRHPRCDVVVKDPTVSRRHAQITFRGSAWVLQDLGSTNGTLVNGVRVGRVALRKRDIITLGNQSIRID